MKKVLLSVFAITISIIAFPQVPQSFSYQAVVRNSSGQTINNQSVNFRISILQGSISGIVSYCETQNATTNNYGLVTLSIGSGTLVTGTFSSINWATGPYFIKIEMDATGGTSYLLMGTSQLLSVPFAKYAESSDNATLPKYSQAQIDKLTLVAGMFVYNTDYKKLQFYDGTQWSGIQYSGCVPKPNIANANNDQLGLRTINTLLDANIPAPGIKGKWEVLIGTGGSFSDSSKQNSIFTGINNNSYLLRWNLMSKCDTNSDEVLITIGMPNINYNGTLYVYPIDNSSSIEWNNGSFSLINATNTTDGEMNTTSIVSNLGVGAYAAYLCDTLNAFGYSDWYLPAKDELNAMYLNKSMLGGFFSNGYWSSTEINSSSAIYKNFNDGTSENQGKGNRHGVRCVRR